jgi:preprotein translocase subunit SecB
MAKKAKNNGGEKPAAEPAAASEAPLAGAPAFGVLAQYVKDLSFENPAAPRSLVQGGQAPNIEISVNVNARGLSENDVEVELKIEGQAGEGANTIFRFDLLYAGVFRLQNVAQEQRMPLILIECPRLLFPFARQLISDAVRNGGFPPLLIDPIDFAALYRQRLAKEAAAQTA